LVCLDFTSGDGLIDFIFFNSQRKIVNPGTFKYIFYNARTIKGFVVYF